MYLNKKVTHYLNLNRRNITSSSLAASKLAKINFSLSIVCLLLVLLSGYKIYENKLEGRGVYFFTLSGRAISVDYSDEMKDKIKTIINRDERK